MTDDAHPDHHEVLAKKGNTLKSGRGLQIWGSQGEDVAEEPGPDPTGGHGNASMGTAERQAKGGVMAPEESKPGERKASASEGADEA